MQVINVAHNIFDQHTLHDIIWHILLYICVCVCVLKRCQSLAYMLQIPSKHPLTVAAWQCLPQSASTHQRGYFPLEHFNSRTIDMFNSRTIFTDEHSKSELILSLSEKISGLLEKHFKFQGRIHFSGLIQWYFFVCDLWINFSFICQFGSILHRLCLRA